MGIFYVESPAMRQLQRKVGRGDFDHLVIHSSIIRPAANRYIRDYILRERGEPYKPLHPILGKVLAETHGIMVYQEDVIRVSMALAGFGWAEADGLRKIIGKKSPEKLSDFRMRFLEGCRGRNIPETTAREVWDMVLSFGGYSFCKPHSASYALVSFKSAFLKVHYPAEFMAAVISNGGGYYHTRAYISEARRMGLEVAGPDINESEWAYIGKDKKIRVGLMQLKGIRQESIENVLGERKRSGPFRSLEDFLGRVRIPPADGSVLVRSGCLDSIAGGINRAGLLWSVEARLLGKQPVMGSRRLLEGRSSNKSPALPNLPVRRIWAQEAETLGFLLSVHPLQLFDVPSKGTVSASELEFHIGRRVSVAGWPITRKEVLTKGGDAMEFVSFEDERGLFEAVFFPGAYRKFCMELRMDRAHLISGRVEEDFGVAGLNVQKVAALKPSVFGCGIALKT